MRLLQLPGNLTTSISANPLTIDINIDIDIKSSLDVNGNIGGRDRLPQSRSRGDWGQKGQDKLDFLMA